MKKTFITNLKGKKKQEAIKRLKHCQELRARQLEHAEMLLVPLKEALEMGEQVLKGRFPIEDYISLNYKVGKYYKFLEGINWNKH